MRVLIICICLSIPTNNETVNFVLHLHLADAFIKSDLQCIKVIHVLSVCVYPGN